jgi:hypothetical protein
MIGGRMNTSSTGVLQLLIRSDRRHPMSWFKTDDSFHEHPKVLSIPEDRRTEAIGLWLTAGLWSARFLTDGMVPAYVVLPADKRRVTRVVLPKLLVLSGLWHDSGCGCNRCPRVPPDHYLFHDWAVYQPTAEKVLAKRKREADKLAAWRARKAAERDADVTGSVTRLHGRRPDAM